MKKLKALALQVSTKLVTGMATPETAMRELWAEIGSIGVESFDEDERPVAQLVYALAAKLEEEREMVEQLKKLSTELGETVAEMKRMEALDRELS